MPDLETLKAKTEAARQKYEEAARAEHDALIARQSRLRQIGAALPTAAQFVATVTQKRRGRPPGSKNRNAQDNVVTMKPAKKRITAEQKASRQTQGRFIGLQRNLSAAKKKMASKIAKESGREAAIRWMESGAKSPAKRTKTRKPAAIVAAPEVPPAESTTAVQPAEMTALQTKESSTPEAATA